MEPDGQNLPPADAASQAVTASPAPSAPRPPGWPYMTYLEAVLMSAALLLFRLGAAVCVGVFVAEAISVLKRSRGDFVPEEPDILMLVNVAAVFPLLVWGWWRSGQRVRQAFGLRAFRWAAIPALVPLGIGAALIASELDNLLRQMIPLEDEFREIFESLMSSPFWAFFVLVVSVPLTEEALFRGVVLRGLLRRHGPWASSFASALLFGLVHVYPAQIMPAFLLGLLLAGIHLRTGSLWPCVWMHAVINALFLVAHLLVPYEIQGLTTPPEAGVFQPLWLDAFAAVLFAAGAAVFFRVTRGASSLKAPLHGCTP